MRSEEIAERLKKFGAAKRCHHPTSQKKADSQFRQLALVLSPDEMRRLGTAAAHVKVEGPGELDDLVKQLIVKYQRR